MLLHWDESQAVMENKAPTRTMPVIDLNTQAAISPIESITLSTLRAILASVAAPEPENRTLNRLALVGRLWHNLLIHSAAVTDACDRALTR